MEKRLQFRHANELTGLFVLAVLALVVGGIILSGYSQHWFSRKYAFDVLLPEKGAFGLSRGNGVLLFGVSVGSVDDIHLGENGRMTAHVKVRGEFGQFVREDSTATIKKVFGVAGDSFIEISRGTGAPMAAHDAVIPCLAAEELPGMLEKMVADLRTEVVPVVKKASATLDTWTNLGADLQTTQAELNQLVIRLDRLDAPLL